MNHPYLRAYMAGIVVPTAFLLVAMTAFTLARFVFEVPVHPVGCAELRSRTPRPGQSIC